MACVLDKRHDEGSFRELLFAKERKMKKKGVSKRDNITKNYRVSEKLGE